MRKNEQKDFTAYESVGGDIYIEDDNGDSRLVLSPNGSDEHEKIAEAIFSMGNESLRAEFEENA